MPGRHLGARRHAVQVVTVEKTQAAGLRQGEADSGFTTALNTHHDDGNVKVIRHGLPPGSAASLHRITARRARIKSDYNVQANIYICFYEIVRIPPLWDHSGPCAKLAGGLFNAAPKEKTCQSHGKHRQISVSSVWR